MTRPVVTHDPDGITECYSDHAHDIRTVGSCEMCGSTDSDVIGHILPHVERLKGVPPIEAARLVLSTGGVKMFDGMLLDTFSASAVVQVHDHLNPDNQTRFRAYDLEKAVSVSFRLLEKLRKESP